VSSEPSAAADETNLSWESTASAKAKLLPGGVRDSVAVQEGCDRLPEGFDTHLDRYVRDFLHIPSNAKTRSARKIDHDLIREVTIGAIGRIYVLWFAVESV